jgi:hypothetical protein
MWCRHDDYEPRCCTRVGFNFEFTIGGFTRPEPWHGPLAFSCRDSYAVVAQSTRVVGGSLFAMFSGRYTDAKWTGVMYAEPRGPDTTSRWSLIRSP